MDFVNSKGLSNPCTPLFGVKKRVRIYIYLIKNEKNVCIVKVLKQILNAKCIGIMHTSQIYHATN